MSSEESPAVSSGRPRRIFRGIWRWTKRIALVVAAILLIARATLGLWLPGLANRAVAPYDLHVTWEDLDLSILGLSLIDSPSAVDLSEVSLINPFDIIICEDYVT